MPHDPKVMSAIADTIADHVGIRWDAQYTQLNFGDLEFVLATLTVCIAAFASMDPTIRGNTPKKFEVIAVLNALFLDRLAEFETPEGQKRLHGKRKGQK